MCKDAELALWLIFGILVSESVSKTHHKAWAASAPPAAGGKDPAHESSVHHSLQPVDMGKSAIALSHC